ncbi:MAG: dihydrofolate reductase [Ktedonobacteraceae bacterium]|nr:dihydrofolate reductase [Ktedonobacteraceae bacterium]
MISIIVAYAHGRVIGRDGQIPWHLPDDKQHFRRVTTGHTIVMGRKTFEAIGRPLPGRRNVVLSHHDWSLPGVEVVHSKQDVLALAGDEIFIIGGAQVYQQFLDIADRLYITEVEADIRGDTFFPAWDRRAFTLLFRQEGSMDERNTLPHTFFLYERKK